MAVALATHAFEKRFLQHHPSDGFPNIFVHFMAVLLPTVKKP